MLPGRTLSLNFALEVLRRRAWVLAVPPLVTAFIAVLYSASLPNVYQSDMLIAIVPQRVPDAFVRTTVTMRPEERLDALTVQVTSRTLLEQLIHEFDLYPAMRERLPMEDVVRIMRDAIVVELERPRRGPRGPEPPHAFHVRFTYPDPNIAARVTGRLGSLFVDQNARDRGALAESTDQFLQVKLVEARKRLEAQERKVEGFRLRHGKELPTQMQSNMQAVQSTQLQIQALVESMARDRDRKLMLERLYREAASEPALVATASGAPSTTDPEGGAGATAQQQLAAARAALAKLELRLKPGHPDVVRTKRLIAELEPKAAAEAAQAAPAVATPAGMTPEEASRRERLRQMAAEIESLERQMRFKEAEDQRLRAVALEYQRRLEAVPGIESEWSVLTRDYDTLQTAYRELLTKSESSKVAVDLEKQQIGEHFRIVDTAEVPVHPISPVRLQINAIGFGVGFLLSACLVAFLEVRDGSLRSEGDVLDVLRLPVLSMVPYIVTRREEGRRKKVRMALGLGAVVVVAGAGFIVWSMRLWNYLV